MNRNKQVWIVRAKPHGNVRIDEFLRDDLVALGWTNLGSLAGKNRAQIKSALRKFYPNDPRNLGVSASQLDTFVNRVVDGDGLIVPHPDGETVYIGAFRGGYRYDKTKDTESKGYPHQRKVVWRSKFPISRKTLPAGIIRKLRAQQPIIATDASPMSSVSKRGAESEAQVRRGLRVMAADADTDGNFFSLEGKLRQVLRSEPQRDRELREKKIRRALKAGGGRLRCEVPGCEFDFEAVYGRLGRGFAHVHHVNQFASGDGQRITREDELKIICANCHAMVHRHGECRKMEELIPRRRRPGTRKERQLEPSAR